MIPRQLAGPKSGWMTANEPSRQQEAVNHGDVEVSGESSLLEMQLGHRLHRRP